MGQVKVLTTTIRKKNPAKPQKKIQVRRTVINNQVQRLNRDAQNKRMVR